MRLRAVARGLPARPEELVAIPQQRLDHAASRLLAGLHRNTEAHHRRLAGVAARLGPGLLYRVLEQRSARLDGQGARLAGALAANRAKHEQRLLRVSARLSGEPIRRRLDQRQARLEALSARLARPLPLSFERAEARLAALGRALATLDPKRPKPGFARIDDETGRMITSAAELAPGQAVSLVFPDGSRGARVEGDAPVRPRPVSKPKASVLDQGDLF